MGKYQGYEKYNDSGVKWLGEIPEHWKSLKIKRLTAIKRGASPRPIDDPKYFDDDGEYAWVRIATALITNAVTGKIDVRQVPIP